MGQCGEIKGLQQNIMIVVDGKNFLNLETELKHMFSILLDMWFDKWDSNGPLCDIIPRREWYRERYNDKETVAQMINNGVWIWPMQWYSNYPILCKIAAPTLTEGTKDKVYWIDSHNVKKEFSTKQAWHDLRGNSEKVECWFSQFQPRHAFILWLATKERLATQDRIAKWNGQISTECPLCKKEKDSHEHLFFKCDFAEKIWYSLKVKMGRTYYNNELKSIMTSLSQTKVNKNIGKVIARIALAAAVYFIWQERNWRIFKQEDRSVEQILKIITDNIRLRLMSLKVKQTSTVIKVAEAWNLKWKNHYLIAD
ncbi:reverse transcriptase zinc-binding domain-containing protein [Tanacetum coccineum]